MAPWTDEKEKKFLGLMISKAGDLNVSRACQELVPLMNNEFSQEVLRWTSDAERAMLIFTIVDGNFRPTAATWDRVAERLGGGLNANAVNQKFYKLKREAEALVAAGAGSSAAPATPAATAAPATPSARKTKTATPSTKAAGSSKGKRKRIDDPTDAANDDDDGTPVKKSRKRVVKKPQITVDLDDVEKYDADENEDDDIPADNDDDTDTSDKRKGKARAKDNDDVDEDNKVDTTMPAIDENEDVD